jgi:hypothetical protein
MIRRVEKLERPGAGRLGRHVEHDERSRKFGLEAPKVVPLDDVIWKRHGRVFDQGELGSCTGNAATGCLMTAPLYRRFHNYGERTAIKVYSRATVLDGFAGSWPPEDTGSSGLAAAAALKERGLIREYRWAFGISEALTALQTGPVITGVDWYEGFDHPDSNGRVRLYGQVRGGHEFLVRGYLRDTNEVLCDNSWGDGWGDHGSFRMYVSDWATLLERDGDVTVLVP